MAAVTNKIGFWLTLAGDFDEADRHIQEGLAMRRRLFGDANPNVASSLENLAILQVAMHRYPEALDSARSSAAIFTSALSAEHWKTAIAESAEGAALTFLGNYDQAEKLLVHSYGILSKDAFVSAAFVSLARGYLDTLHRDAAPLAAGERRFRATAPPGMPRPDDRRRSRTSTEPAR